MKRLITLLVLAAVALLPGSALAHSRAKVFSGTFDMVGDGDYVTGKFGHAQLVDNRRNDHLSVHVRRLAPKQKYVFRLQQAPKACEAGAPAGTDVPGWKYRRGGVLKTSRKGVANSSARSRTFKAQKGVEYFVGVFTATATGEPDQLVLCAELRRKGHHKSGHKSHPKPDKHDGKSEHKAKKKDKADKRDKGDHAGGRDEDKTRGKSEESHGKSDESHGKSDDAAGHADDKAHGNGNANGKDKPRAKKSRR